MSKENPDPTPPSPPIPPWGKQLQERMDEAFRRCTANELAISAANMVRMEDHRTLLKEIQKVIKTTGKIWAAIMEDRKNAKRKAQ